MNIFIKVCIHFFTFFQNVFSFLFARFFFLTRNSIFSLPISDCTLFSPTEGFFLNPNINNFLLCKRLISASRCSYLRHRPSFLLNMLIIQLFYSSFFCFFIFNVFYLYHPFYLQNTMSFRKDATIFLRTRILTILNLKIVLKNQTKKKMNYIYFNFAIRRCTEKFTGWKVHWLKILYDDVIYAPDNIYYQWDPRTERPNEEVNTPQGMGHFWKKNSFGPILCECCGQSMNFIANTYSLYCNIVF